MPKIKQMLGGVVSLASVLIVASEMPVEMFPLQLMSCGTLVLGMAMLGAERKVA